MGRNRSSRWREALGVCRHRVRRRLATARSQHAHTWLIQSDVDRGRRPLIFAKWDPPKRRPPKRAGESSRAQSPLVLHLDALQGESPPTEKETLARDSSGPAHAKGRDSERREG
jgi:hypothetical protein